MSRRDPGAPLFLVGFMGSGKTAVGRALAARRSWSFADTDAMVERALGRAVEDIFRALGEGSFRQAESEALRSLARASRTVVATGGGLFLSVPARAFLRAHGTSVWLDVPLSIARARLGDGSGRPLWPKGDALDGRAFFERRRACYALADFSVDASADDPADVAEAIEERWGSLRR